MTIIQSSTLEVNKAKEELLWSYTRTQTCISQIDYVSDRMLMVKLSGDPVDVFIIVVYMPTTYAEDEEVEEQYEQLENLMGKSKCKDYLVLSLKNE